MTTYGSSRGILPWVRQGVVSLLDMLSFSLRPWIEIGESFNALSNHLSPEHIAFISGDKERIISPLERISTACRELGLDYSERSAMELIEKYANEPTILDILNRPIPKESAYEKLAAIQNPKLHPQEQLVQDIEFLKKTIDLELKGCRFFGVLPPDARRYGSASWLGAEVIRKFPSVEWEAVEALNCIALDRDTACVFHCMRILEWGLASLAESLKVLPTSNPNWYQVLNACERQIKELIKHDPDWKRNEQFYNSAALQFNHFRLALRNHVSHARVKYSHVEARAVMDQVAAFMQELSKRLGEVPLPGVSLGPDVP